VILHFDFPGLARFDGFVSIKALIFALSRSRDFNFSGSRILKWWEYDSYVGVAGSALILGACVYALYGLYLKYSKSSRRLNADDYVLLIPAL
jgi:hypothetical protein